MRNEPGGHQHNAIPATLLPSPGRAPAPPADDSCAIAHRATAGHAPTDSKNARLLRIAPMIS